MPKKEAVIVDDSLKQLIETATCVQQKTLISSVIQNRRRYIDVSPPDSKSLDFGRTKGGIILPNLENVFCPGVNRRLLNLAYSGGWTRVSRPHRFVKNYTDSLYNGAWNKSLAAVLEDIASDAVAKEYTRLCYRLGPSCGSVTRATNRVRYPFFDGDFVKEISIVSNKPENLLADIHEQQREFLIQYLKVTAEILRTDISKLSDRNLSCSADMFQ